MRLQFQVSNFHEKRLYKDQLVDDIDWEISDEDEEAYDDCDGTETGAMKEFCESGVDKRVSFYLKYFSLKFLAVFSFYYRVVSRS